ncbi:hypothetical protein [Bradyrhizobium sp. Rc2d]|uniref:hypothetical protein n=1 Tax=Bradyrhizobium sp. Rc2d TaxID=1855321 RepID=UPI0015A413D5
MIATVRNTSLADRGSMNVSHLVSVEIHEPVMQLASEGRRDRDKVNKAVRREPPLRRRDPDARLVDPGFPREPRVIGAADRTTGAREKHRAAPKALAISLDTGGNRVSGLRTFDHDHSHVALPCDLSLL